MMTAAMIRFPSNHLRQPQPSLQPPQAAKEKVTRWLAERIRFSILVKLLSVRLLARFCSSLQNTYACAYPRNQIHCRKIPRRLLPRGSCVYALTL